MCFLHFLNLPQPLEAFHDIGHSSSTLLAYRPLVSMPLSLLGRILDIGQLISRERILSSTR